MSGLSYILFAALIVWFWHDSLRTRELATTVSKRACSDKLVQFLDQTVALARIGLRWTRQGIRLRRIYSFEYSIEGVGRRQGEVVMLGSRLESLSIDISAQESGEQ